MNWNFVEKDIYKLYGKKVEKVEKLGGYGDKFNFTAISSGDGEKLVFKVKFCKADTNRDQLLNQAITQLHNRGFIVPLPRKRNENILDEDIEIFRYVIMNNLGREASDELLSYVPGGLLGFTNTTEKELPLILFNLGKYLALIDLELQNFSDETKFGKQPENPFFVHHSLVVRNQLSLIDDAEDRHTIESFLNGFEQKVIPKLPVLRKGLIHGDFNDLNITVLSKQLAMDATQIDEIKTAFGAFDFEDSHFGYYVFELAICMVYLIIKALRDGNANPWTCGARILAGYNQIFPLTKDELDVLYWAVASRFCVSLVMSKSHPVETSADNDLLYFHSELCGPALRDMYSRGEKDITANWFDNVRDQS